MRIAVTRRIPEAGLAPLAEEAEVVVWPKSLPPNREELIGLAAGADGLLTLLTERVDGELLDALPTVRAVSNMAVGYDNIDVEAATTRGVVVCITPDVLTETTADFTFTLLLAVARRVKPAADAVLRGEWKTWEPLGFLGQDVYGSTLGIIGMGRIGQAVARRARGFAMTILYTDQAPRPEIENEVGARFVGIDQLLRESDVVSLHVPLTREARKMIGAEQLRMMKRSAILINTARGGVIDTEALADALESGAIWAAGLDVTDPEPLPADHRLLRLPNVLVTPHIASASEATRTRMARLAAENLLAALRGERPPRSINWEAVRGHAQS